MKTKILYILISNERDLYLEQALLSLHSLRLHTPNAFVTLLIDDLTAQTLVGSRANITNFITEKIVVSLDAGMSNKQRSRFLKTSMREHVSGDFLFIDVDTIINAPLSEIDTFQFDVGAVKDLHISSLSAQPEWHWIKSFLKKIGGELNGNYTYFNSGVLYVKDNNNTRSFFKKWNALWLIGNKNGLVVDQPALALADKKHNQIIRELPGVWNCQPYWGGLKYLYSSKIIHYLGANDNIRLKREPFACFADANTFIKLRDCGHILNGELLALLQSPLNYINDKTIILYGAEVEFWYSFAVRLIRYCHKKYPKAYRLFNWFSKKVYLLRIRIQ